MFDAVRQLLDLVIVVVGALIAYTLAPDIDPRMIDARGMMIALDAALVALIFPMLNVYQSWRGKSAFALSVPALGGWLVAQVIGVSAYAMLHRVSHVPHAWLVWWTVFTAALFVISRQIIATVLGRLRSAGYNQKRVAIVGATPDAVRLVQRMAGAPHAGYLPVAIYDESSATADDTQGVGVPVLHRWDALTQLIRQSGITELWLTGRPSEPHPCDRYIGEFKHDFVNIRLLPDLDNLALANLGTVDVLGLPSINLVAAPRSGMSLIQKDIFDRMFAAVVLLMLAPVFVVVAIAVKMSSAGPVLFKQRRKGVDGNEFWIYKFRSMRVHQAETGTIRQATKGDARITRVGAILRKTSIDELPQFLNVLKGDMSVVGPRPHAVEHDEQYKNLVQNYMYRYRIKPGITGWAQVNGFRGETDRVEKMADRVACDLYYMVNWTFWFDVKIVFMTLARGFIGANAY
ncbi:undecaprenyl-phosphate glucose phosphotransferase [Pararobbsia silviterrae]|uniref:Undecaprenyl-phosphate glucose phosphotransferase n=1 Tax=Pararobbsia silviterrae TaxID=1792498 RepID=A0A494YAF8_9BURK|nr:undecaprenyl-phosphate glucose phosphotransferase [Pararobbsia silviterrae]RKP59145.1 undecaprenyl-phosphate glucose phosphotransferase [Pararobbsia silviterrae]